MELDIVTLRKLYEKDMVFSTQHLIERCNQREISEDDIHSCIDNGKIIEQYPDDYPWPSCLICGTLSTKKIIHVVIGSNGETAKLITAYWPDPLKWNKDFTIRKEQ